MGVRFYDVNTEVVTLRYFQTDHLGSVAVITDAAGVVTERLSYDAWGKRRHADGADDPTGSIVSQTTRGFTGHEELAIAGLVHMNGRDLRFDDRPDDQRGPDRSRRRSGGDVSGRFRRRQYRSSLRPDQRGHSWLSSFFHSVGRFFKSILQSPIVRAVVQIVIAAVLSVPLGPVAAAAISAAVVTGLAGGKLGDILKAAAIAGATASAFNFVGGATNAIAGVNPSGPHITPQFGSEAHLFNIAGHAAVGCVSAVASGGKCQSGAASAAAGSFFAPAIGIAFRDPHNNPSDLFGGTVASGVVGGLASVAGGGKFENGAVTGAFGYLFNQARRGGRSTSGRLVEEEIREALNPHLRGGLDYSPRQLPTSYFPPY